MVIYAVKDCKSDSQFNNGDLLLEHKMMNDCSNWLCLGANIKDNTRNKDTILQNNDDFNYKPTRFGYDTGTMIIV